MGGGYDSVKAIKGKFSPARYIGQMGCGITVIKRSIPVDLDDEWRDAQLLRGQFLDAFARLEGAVMLYIQKTDVNVAPAAPFSQKLAALERARNQFRNPKRLDVRVAAIRELLAIRADIVHSVLEVAASFDGKTATTKLHCQNASDAARRPLIITTQQLTRMTGRLNQLAAQFSHQRMLGEAPAAPASAT